MLSRPAIRSWPSATDRVRKRSRRLVRLLISFRPRRSFRLALRRLPGGDHRLHKRPLGIGRSPGNEGHCALPHGGVQASIGRSQKNQAPNKENEPLPRPEPGEKFKANGLRGSPASNACTTWALWHGCC